VTIQRVQKKEAKIFYSITLTYLESFVIFGTNDPDTLVY